MAVTSLDLEVCHHAKNNNTYLSIEPGMPPELRIKPTSMLLWCGWWIDGVGVWEEWIGKAKGFGSSKRFSL